MTQQHVLADSTPQPQSSLGPRFLVFWRHGRTAWNAAGRLQGQSDIELDEIGHQQIELAAQVLAGAFPDAAILTSDLKRAQQTAAVISQLTGQPVTVDERLRERSFGEWEGLERTEIARRWPAIFSAWQRGSDAVGKPPGGESRREVGLRIAEAVREHVANGAADALDQAPDPSARAGKNNEVLLIVGHGAAITAGITALIGEDPGDWHGITGLDNANWSILERKPHAACDTGAANQTQAANQKNVSLWRLMGHNLSAAPFNLGEVFGA